MQVLGGLVDDAVDFLGGRHDAHRDGARGGADLGGDDGATLAAQDRQPGVGVKVGADDLQHASGLDGGRELLGVGVDVGADVCADPQRCGVDLVEVADLVGGGGVAHGFDSLSNRWNGHLLSSSGDESRAEAKVGLWTVVSVCDGCGWTCADCLVPGRDWLRDPPSMHPAGC